MVFHSTAIGLFQLLAFASFTRHRTTKPTLTMATSSASRDTLKNTQTNTILKSVISLIWQRFAHCATNTGLLGRSASRGKSRLYHRVNQRRNQPSRLLGVQLYWRHGGWSRHPVRCRDLMGTLLEYASLSSYVDGSRMQPTPNLFYSTAGRPPSTLEPNDAEPYLEWVQAILNMDPKDVCQ